MGGYQNYGPFLGTLNTRGRIIIGIQKGTIILTTTHIWVHPFLDGPSEEGTSSKFMSGVFHANLDTGPFTSLVGWTVESGSFLTCSMQPFETVMRDESEV